MKTNIPTWFDYIAFDASNSSRRICEDAIARVYGNDNRRYFNDPADMLATYDLESFDVVVLCNVLHEIEPEEWLSLFGADGLISKVLKPSGFALIVEDNQIPVGEKPHQKGFLVLDTAQIKALFAVKEADTAFTVRSEGRGRLKAHQVPKECLIRINTESRREAIKGIAEMAKQRIVQLRAEQGTYQNGRLHGYWVQQFANAELFLGALG